MKMCSNEITQKDLHDLLEVFERKPYEAAASDEFDNAITLKCESLFKLDYSLLELDNSGGVLSPKYPSRIFIPDYDNNQMVSTITNKNANIVTNHNYGNDEIDDSGGGGLGDGGGIKTNGFLSNGSLSYSNLNGLNGFTNNSIHSFVTFAHPLQQSAMTMSHPLQELQSRTIPTSMIPPSCLQTSQQKQNHLQQHLQLQPQPTTILEEFQDIKVRDLITMAKYARCRRRFAVPVIMYRDKYICRSATISVMPETYGRKVVDYAYDCLNGTNYTDRSIMNNEDNENGGEPSDESLTSQINDQSLFSYQEVIKSDIQLLNTFNVSTIVDLMVEKRKIKYFMPVSSSEKADPENHYDNFNILSLPYPGCEFFKKFRDNNYMAKNLIYNWKQSFNDAIINIPKLGPALDLDINWFDYKKWDLVQITQNYLKAILKYIQEESSGLLIHCISGWDRTPLFISLVRLSLWADGLIHASLTPLQMAYLTLAYDWYLFGHQLPDRLKRGEDIMFFCFHFLKYITDEEFSVIEHRKRTKTSSSSGSSVIVIKADCCDDPLKEEYILNFDQDSNDSFSNNSNCDMSITDNFFTNTTPTTAFVNTASTNIAATTPATAIAGLTSRSPNPKRSKTSPISVPGSSAAARQRQESTSSNGSWQVVTDTGSIDSVMNGSYMMRFINPHHYDNGSVQSYAANNSGSGGGCGGGGGSGGGYHSNGSVTSSNSSSNGPYSNGISTQTTNAQKDSNSSTTTKSNASTRKERLNEVRATFIRAYGKTIGLKFKEGSSGNLTALIGNIAEQLF